VPRALDRRGLSAVVGHALSIPKQGDTIVWMGGGLLGGPGGAFSTRYGIDRFGIGPRQYLTLDSLIRTEGPHPAWKVLDAVWIPPFPDSLVFSEGCAYESQLQTGDMNPDRGIEGIAVSEEAEFYPKVLFAVTADTLTRRFRLLNPTTLRCVNESWGLP